MSGQDARVEDLIAEGVHGIVDSLHEPLRKRLGGVLAWGWDELEGPLGELVAKGVLELVGKLGVETGHVKVTVAPGARVAFEVLPPKSKE